MNPLARRSYASPHRLSLTGLLKRLIAADAVWRERKALRDMDAVRLADLGLTRDEALEESRKSPWDVPSHWRK